ncbi:MAG: hypothetical protein OEX10_04040 [Candidatus Bathyarchaeota archaeon]|nr:hypothetical protein [Candidatus Bathyarchaeota archaeon]
MGLKFNPTNQPKITAASRKKHLLRTVYTIQDIGIFRITGTGVGY